MPDFAFTRDIVYAALIYVIVLSCILIWLFGSKQTILSRNAFNVFCIAVRLAILFALIIGLCWVAGIAVWLVMLAAMLLVAAGVLVDLPISGLFGFALLYVSHQFVLGFPARHEWMRGDAVRKPTHSTIDPHQNLVGATGVTISPLRPIGDVRVGDKTYRAKSNLGKMLDVGQPIVVVAVSAEALIVRVSSGEEEFPSS